MAEALYRKYRPQVFRDMIGQEHIERTLKNAIEQDKVSHAYLFTGPRGTGKTTTARLLAKALLCQKGQTPEPDGTCEDCNLIAAGEHPDVYELDAASRTGVENVREEIIGRVQYAPTRGRRKIYIIDEVHMLSTAAFNALLKTLEEPPDHVVFILATTDPQKVPETIHSRCQRFDFHRIGNEAIVSKLGAICVEEGVEFEGDALDLIAHRSEGGMRNALTTLEQLIAYGQGTVTLEVAERMLGSLSHSDMAEIVTAIGQRNIAACFTWTAQYMETGADLAQFTRDLAQTVRNMYVMCLTDSEVPLDITEAERAELARLLPLFGPERLSRLLIVLGDLSAELRTSTNPRLSFEIAMTRAVRPDSDISIDALAERIEALERGYSAVAPVVAAAPVIVQAAPAATSAAAVANTAQASTSAAARQAVETEPAAQPAVQAAEVSAAQTSVQDEPTVQESAAPRSSAASLGIDLTNPATMQRSWQAVMQTLKRNKAAYAVLFMNTKARYDEALGMITVEFPAESSFAYKAVQKPDVHASLSEALAQSLGQAIPFSFVQAGGAALAATQTIQTSQASQSAQAVQPARTTQAAQAQASQPEQAAQQQSTAAGFTPAAGFTEADYDDDEVPVDLYDDACEAAPWDDEPVAYAAPAAVTEAVEAARSAQVAAADFEAEEAPVQAAADAAPADPAADQAAMDNLMNIFGDVRIV